MAEEYYIEITVRFPMDESVEQDGGQLNIDVPKEKIPEFIDWLRKIKDEDNSDK